MGFVGPGVDERDVAEENGCALRIRCGAGRAGLRLGRVNPVVRQSNSKTTAPAAGWSGPTAAVAMITSAFFVVNAFLAFRHVMWRDEWMPLNVARFAGSGAEWFAEIRYIGRWAFFGLIWLIERCGGHPWLFKFVIVAISTLGVYVVCRWSPFTRVQKALFAFGYYPLYEYGTILRDYSIVWTMAVICCGLLAAERRRPLAFGIALAVLFQTNPFGLGLAAAFGITYVFDLWRRGDLAAGGWRRPEIWGGGLIAAASFGVAFVTMRPPPEIAEIVLGQPLRTDSHLVRLVESLPFPFRGWLPVPFHGEWNSQLLDPWPLLQMLLGAGVAAVVLICIAGSPTATCLFAVGMLGLGAILCHLPWTSLRYHGPYFLVLVCSYWLAERWAPLAAEPAAASLVGRIRRGRSQLFTGLLLIHAVVGAMFAVQEQLIPFSGAQEAAKLIRANEPADVLVIGDPDYAMISLAGCLDRQIYIASREELGAFTRVDKRRRGTPLTAEELSRVVAGRLTAEQRDVVLVTSYPVTMPPELGTLVGATRGVCDERYFIYRVRYRRPSGP